MTGVAGEADCACQDRVRKASRGGKRLLASCLLLALGLVPALGQAQEFPVDSFPTWVTVPAGAAEETVVLKHPSHLTLFNLRPEEAFALTAPVLDERNKQLLAEETQLIRVPGPEMIACQAVRPKGNERFTCLKDADRDGLFDEYFRPAAQSNLFILALQQFRPAYTPLAASVAYREVDERTESPTTQFIMQHAVQGKLIIIKFCFEPYRRVKSCGFPHAVDDCLVRSLTHRRGQQYPYTLSLLGADIAVLSYDEKTKETTFRVRRKAEEFPISFGFEYK